MSLGALDQDDAGPGRRSRFGLRLSLDGYHGQSLRLSDPEVVRPGLDEMRSRPCSGPPDPAVISCRSKESGTGTVRDVLTPARAHVPS